jgi:hypothetical protein
MIDLRWHVERSTFAVDHDLGLADRHPDVGARFADVDRSARGVIAHRRAHLFEHRAQWNENRVPADECRERPVLLDSIGLRVHVNVVEEDRHLTRGRRAEIRGRRGAELRDDTSVRVPAQQPEGQSRRQGADLDTFQLFLRRANRQVTRVRPQPSFTFLTERLKGNNRTARYEETLLFLALRKG